MSSGPTVGVLALQGDFAEHEAALRHCGLRCRQVRRSADLVGLAGLVLPGGESTTMLKLLDVEQMWQPLGAALRSGMPVLATCAGLILLAERVENPNQRSYGLLPVTVVRNGYGRQYHSGTFALVSDVLPPGTTGTFIRAPRITHTGPGCEVLARRDDDPVLVRSGAILAACFHPELALGHPVTARFAAAVRAHAGAAGRGAAAATAADCGA
ncbi:MAG: pyridoxal 5'-phosphate synthase glutaminase subunit PdxT [Planctomycetes bacterium]|nr:pyridoxal 5'-phosphate synthase glutaminase subunit PdxT [Planctomycetota bacterium]